MQTQSKVLKRPLLNWLAKSKTTKRSLADDLKVSRQSPSDWTADKPKPVTPENAVRISDIANDTDLTMQIIWKFFGIFRPLDGDMYRQDLSSTDSLRELEENERDEAKQLAQRVLLKQVHKLKKADYDLLLKFSKEQAEAVFANIQYLNALCEVQNLSIMDLFEYFMPMWQEAGYFGGDN
ncbi:hypothetical protein [Enterococcus nangangensis]|uniref:hypothetical protein n=1 Tax=Enterococcus nangangensis TaxID=2559926 RepID=UPI0010F7507B|nr:hypothetical protein [Enterococcus nangangensis]